MNDKCVVPASSCPLGAPAVPCVDPLACDERVATAEGASGSPAAAVSCCARTEHAEHIAIAKAARVERCARLFITPELNRIAAFHILVLKSSLQCSCCVWV